MGGAPSEISGPVGRRISTSLAAVYWITSSAVANIISGTVRLRALAGIVCLLSAQEKNAARATPILGPPPRLLAEHRIIVATLIMLAVARLIPLAALLFTREALMTAPHASING
jgi:hypothetical protein